ncbi:MAG: antibiotic biosynthesis monooxygenase [Nocardioidaceae bacterium]
MSWENAGMFVISRFRYGESAVDAAGGELGSCLDHLSRQPGFVGGSVGRAIDDPSMWTLETRWAGVGPYRRALSSYDVKLHVVPLLSRALDEPSAYEVIVGEGAAEPNRDVPRNTDHDR